MSVNAVQSDGSLKRIAGGVLYADAPVGTIMPYGGATVPSGYLLCNGQVVSRTTYAALFAAIGTTYGTGDGSTTFNVPDLRGKFAEGTPNGGTLGETKSAGLPEIEGSLGTLTMTSSNGSTDWIESGALRTTQRYKIGDTGLGQIPTTSTEAATSTGAKAPTFKASRSNAIYGNSDTVQPPAVYVNYIIKATQIAVPTDILAGVESLLEPKILAISKVSNNYFEVEDDSYACQVGKMVTVNLAINVKESYVDWAEFATIPGVIVANRTIGSFNQNYCELRLEKGVGVTRIYSAQRAVGQYYMSFSYQIS